MLQQLTLRLPNKWYKGIYNTACFLTKLMGMFSADLYVGEIILVSAPLRLRIAPVRCLARRRKGWGRREIGFGFGLIPLQTVMGINLSGDSPVSAGFVQ